MIGIGRPTGSLAALCVSASLIFAGTARAAEPAPTPQKWHPWWELGGYYGTDDASRGEVTIFAPVTQSAASLFFAEMRGKFFEQDTQEINFALGHRRMLNSGWNFGFWGGLDVRSTEADNSFWQVSGGLEALSPRWDLRVNGYVPITEPKSSPSLAEVRLSGNSIFMVGGEEVPLYGVDGEVGFKIFGGHRGGGGKDSPASGRRTELRVYGGGFYFDDEDALQEVAGLKTRLEFRIEDIIAAMPGSRLTLESEYSHDDVRDDKWEVGARLRIPFGGSREGRAAAYAALTAQERRMTEGVERDTDIVTARSEAENVFDDTTNVAMDQVAFANSATSVASGVNTGGNTLIIVQGSGANINVSAGQAALQANQTVQGGGSTINYRGAKSGTVAPFTAPGSRPTLFSNANAAIVGLAGNNHVAGLNILGSGAGGGQSGISGTGGLGNVAVTYNTISQTGGTGISVTNLTGTGSNLTINHNTVSQAGADGIRAGFAGSGSGTLTLNDNTVSQAALDGIQITAFNDATVVSEIMHNRVSNAGADAIRFDLQNNTVTRLNLSGNTFTGPASDGIEFDIENNAWITGTISNNTITDTTFGEGIEIDQDQNSFANLVISGNVIQNVFADPLDIDLDNTSTGFYQVVGNVFSSPQAASLIDIDTNDNAFLGAQVAGNTTNVNLDFDEDGASTFQLENTIGTNTLLGGAALVIDPLIEIVPPGTFFPFP